MSYATNNMRFKKIYIEITNVCNFSCSFCFQTSRHKKFMSPGEFSSILVKIKPYTNYIYLHVLGEPLLHPQLEILLSAAHEKGFFINITTNGSLIGKRKNELINQPVRQFNISLHDAEENIPKDKWKEYFYDVFDFANEKSAESYFSLRLWNRDSVASIQFNNDCLDAINSYFGTRIDLNDFKETKNLKIKDHVFLQNSVRFSWPGEQELGIRQRTCYALKDHIAILADGRVAPCCLDAGAQLMLGNIFENDLENILNGEKAQRMISGFQKRMVSEKICMDCGFNIGEKFLYS